MVNYFVFSFFFSPKGFLFSNLTVSWYGCVNADMSKISEKKFNPVPIPTLKGHSYKKMVE
jgi:hypothetical protein